MKVLSYLILAVLLSAIGGCSLAPEPVVIVVTATSEKATNTPEPTRTPRPTFTPTPSEADLIFEILQDAKYPSWVEGIEKVEALPSMVQIESGYRSAVFVTLSSVDVIPAPPSEFGYTSSLDYLLDDDVAGLVAVIIYDDGSDAWKTWDLIANDIMTNTPPLFAQQQGDILAGMNCWGDECDPRLFQIAASIRSHPTIVWHVVIVGPKDLVSYAVNDIYNSSIESIFDVVE